MHASNSHCSTGRCNHRRSMCCSEWDAAGREATGGSEGKCGCQDTASVLATDEQCARCATAAGHGHVQTHEQRTRGIQPLQDGQGHRSALSHEHGKPSRLPG